MISFLVSISFAMPSLCQGGKLSEPSFQDCFVMGASLSLPPKHSGGSVVE